MTREWTVSSTLGGGVKRVTISANTWGELKQALNYNGIKTDGMKVSIKTDDGFVTNSDHHNLPDNANVIAITPEGTKNGK